MNIDPKDNKSDQIFSYKCLVRPCQNEHGHSPEKVDIPDVFIMRFHTYLSFRA